MGYDIYGKWFAQNPDGNFEELDLGEDAESTPLSEWGRNSVMYQWLGLANTHLPQVTPVKQTEVPEALKAHLYPEAPASGCVKLSDFESYPYASREWTGQTLTFAFDEPLPLTFILNRVTNVIRPRAAQLAGERETYFIYAIG